MKLLVCLLGFIFVSCGKPTTSNKKIQEKIKEIHETSIFNEVIGVKEGGPEGPHYEEVNFIRLGQPLWQIKINDLKLSDKNYELSPIMTNKNPWQYLKRRFFLRLRNKYFQNVNNNDLKINYDDLFISSFDLKRVSKTQSGNKLILEGESTFFNEKFYSADDLGESNLWIGAYLGDYHSKNKIFQKKMIEGENYFFDSSTISSPNSLYSIFIDSILPQKENDFENFSRLILSADNFNHKNFSKRKILENLKYNYDLLLHFDKKISVYLVEKGAEIFEVLKKIDPLLHKDQYNHVLSTTSLVKNDFLSDFPRLSFVGNNLMSKGVLFFSDEILEGKVHYFYSGTYLNIFKNSIDDQREVTFLRGSSLSIDIEKGQMFQIATTVSNDKNIFEEKVRSIDVIEKKQRLECERYELKNDKLCIDMTRRFKKNAIFREFTKKEKSRDNKTIFNKHFSSLRSDRKIKLEKLNIFGEEFFLPLEWVSESEIYLTSLNILEKFQPRKCEVIRTGYIGLQVPDDSLKPIKPQAITHQRYCEGPSYLHKVVKSK